MYDTLIGGARVLDGSGGAGFVADVGLTDGRIVSVGNLQGAQARERVDGDGMALAPGFIDVHTHDDTNVIRTPDMLPKLSQGVTTVIVGNCGISAAPVSLRGDPPDPMNLLGGRQDFRYPDFAAYAQAVNAARPTVNVAALVGHTALRSNHLDRLDRRATDAEIVAMRAQLREALQQGALGLSTGLAYASAQHADTSEVQALAEELNSFGGLYTTHLRSEFGEILQAMQEAYDIAGHARVPVIVSHLKCAGAGNWGRSHEVLSSLENAERHLSVGCDCYPYSASSSTLDLKQVTEDYDIDITWSEPHPGMAGRKLAAIAEQWEVSLMEAARRLQPAGAVYHGMHEADVRRILAHRLTMVGSDGLPNDPQPHPRLWGAFPRVLGHYSRELRLFSLEQAIHKMTGLSAARFGLQNRGLVRVGHHADLVLFDPEVVADRATYAQPQQAAQGIAAVWVNGALSYRNGALTGARAGRWLAREGDLRASFRTFSQPWFQETS